ncbi:MAG TPA: DUF2147 domain-containing protein [Bradyrhizobium sp.]|nr:DUF2147 domain-containing protein [Bradyrhizobium sp.]
MNKLTILAALLMTTSYAYAGGNSVSFEIDGHKIRIEAPKNCDQLSCLKVSGFDFNGFNSKRFDDDDDAAAKPGQPAPAPAAQANAPQAPAAPAANPSPAPVTVAATPSQPALKEEVAPPAPPAAPRPAPAAAAPVQAPTTPIGVWATEDDKGQVRIEQCGANLCGYAVKSGERVLINMKAQDTKWVGTIHDPDSGRNYDSTIAMKGTNALRVQGCAFGGMFCGGQVWNRVS